MTKINNKCFLVQRCIESYLWYTFMPILCMGQNFLQFSVCCSSLRFNLLITNCLNEKILLFLNIFSCLQCSQHPALFVCVSHAHFTFFAVFIHGPDCSWFDMTPAYLLATVVAVFPALLKMHEIFLISDVDLQFCKSLSVCPSVGLSPIPDNWVADCG